ncbi:glucose-6-phosphate dehydrogenase (coenzyme-F420) [Pseudactinotalea sp.]|uniref:glucose-6-phosphate dehydrogenase (coenzyme-F420) n=1 Tax=Pseudactinotalea sp. TaxID=1926260 RepID=UPI003B3A0834
MKFGYKASAEQFSPSHLLELGLMAEQAGFDSVFISDHLQPWRHHGGHAPAALPWLGALVSATERIIVGTSVLTPTLRYHPAVIAQAFATLGCLAPGRVVLGVGSGEAMNEAPLGVPWPRPRERITRLAEAIDIIQRLWREERLDYAGQYYNLRQATIYDRPTVPVPLYAAASGPVATRLAGRVADGFITTSGKGESLYTQRLLPALATGAAEAGRTVKDLELVMEVKVSFDPDRDRAAADTRFWGALALSSEEKTGVEDPLVMERLADALPLERTASRWIVSDDPEEHVEQIWRYGQMGFTHLVFHAPGPDQARFLDLYSEAILPRLRARAERDDVVSSAAKVTAGGWA